MQKLRELIIPGNRKKAEQSIRTTVAELHPGLMHKRGRLCLNIHSNLLASIFMHNLVQEFRQTHPTLKFPLPPNFEQSISLVKNVPVYMYTKDQHNYHPFRIKGKHFKAKSVLVKRACGLTSGLVLQGPLKGLILEPLGQMHEFRTDTDLQTNGLNLAYFYQKFNFSKDHLVYPFHFLFYLKDDYPDISNRFIAEAKDKVLSWWQQQQNQSINSSDLLLSLLADNNIAHQLSAKDLVPLKPSTNIR